MSLRSLDICAWIAFAEGGRPGPQARRPSRSAATGAGAVETSAASSRRFCTPRGVTSMPSPLRTTSGPRTSNRTGRRHYERCSSSPTVTSGTRRAFSSPPAEQLERVVALLRGGPQPTSSRWGAGSAASSSDAQRVEHAARAPTCSTSRASGAPTHVCGPWPNATCRLGLRSRRSSVGVRGTSASSRLALAIADRDQVRRSGSRPGFADLDLRWSWCGRGGRWAS